MPTYKTKKTVSYKGNNLVFRAIFVFFMLAAINPILPFIAIIWIIIFGKKTVFKNVKIESIDSFKKVLTKESWEKLFMEAIKKIENNKSLKSNKVLLDKLKSFSKEFETNKSSYSTKTSLETINIENKESISYWEKPTSSPSKINKTEVKQIHNNCKDHNTSLWKSKDTKKKNKLKSKSSTSSTTFNWGKSIWDDYESVTDTFTKK